MASCHLLRVLRPTYLSRTLPLYTGVFHRHFSDTPVPSPQSSSEATLAVDPVKRGRPPKPRSSSEDTLPDKPVKRGRPPKPRSSSEDTLPDKPVKRGRPPSLSTVDGAETEKKTRKPKKPKKPRRKSLLTEEDEASMKVSKLELPPIDKWRQYFAIMEGQRLRFFLRNPDTAQKLAEKFVPEGSKDLIVIEAAAGPGQLTRALLNLPKERIKKLLVLEKPEKLLEFLTPLEEVDSRLRVFPWGAKDWNSYTRLASTGLLDELKIVDWKKVHPQLRYILHINSTVEGEQLLSQLMRAIPDRQWLFKYGRVPMQFILSSRMWDRVRGETSQLARCKVSVMAQAAAHLSEAVPYDFLQPFQEHFHPTVPRQEEIRNMHGLDERRTGNPMSAITAIPLKHQEIKPGELDYWDFCLRKLFVQKATSLEKCISLLGPGARNILPKLTDKSLPPEERVDVKKTPRSFDIREWALIVRAFKDWPFRPEDLSIDNVFIQHQR